MPLYDITAANRQAVQSGLALGQAMFQNDLRMQQFKSEEALRRIQEQQAAETLRYAQWQHSQMIDQQAENAKRTADFQSMITPTLQMPANDMTEFAPMIGPDGQPMAKPNVVNGMTEVPNPAHVPDMGAAYIQAFLPGNPNPAQVIATGGALSLHQAQAAKAKADAARHANGINPQTGEVILPDGRKISYAQESDGSVRYFPPDTFADRQRIIDERQTKQKLVSEALKIDASQVAEDGTILPGGWAAIQKRGSMSPSTVAAAEKQAMSGDNAIRAAKDALQTIQEHPEAIGLMGAGRGIGERAAGQLGLRNDAPTAKARQKLALAFTQLADSLKVDSGNMSRYERNKLEEVGDPTRWQESPATARDMMNNILNVAIAKQLRTLGVAGKQPDDALLMQIPESEIVDLVRNQLLTEDQAVRWQKLRLKSRTK